jgi:hypothetical protein
MMWLRRALYFAYTLPLVGLISQFVRIQFSVLALGFLAATICLLMVRRRSIGYPAPMHSAA